MQMSNKINQMEIKKKEKLKMLILDGYRMKLTIYRNRFRMSLVRIRIKNISNRLITQNNRFWKYQEIKIIKLQTRTMEVY